MVYIALFLFELFLLFFLSSFLTKSLSFFFFRLTKSKTLTIQLLALIFLPGVIVHELSHLITAGVLFVKTGEIEFLPKLKDNGELKLGSVELAKTDPVRRAVIGVAPILFGMLVIFSTLVILACPGSFFDSGVLRLWLSPQNDGCSNGLLSQTIMFYIIFEVSNTMFSSRKDLEGTLELILTIGVLTALFYIIGVRLDFSFVKEIVIFDFEEFLKKLNMFLLAPIIIDIFSILILRIFHKGR